MIKGNIGQKLFVGTQDGTLVLYECKSDGIIIFTQL